jgi:hypothetical protein
MPACISTRPASPAAYTSPATPTTLLIQPSDSPAATPLNIQPAAMAEGSKDNPPSGKPSFASTIPTGVDRETVASLGNSMSHYPQQPMRVDVPPPPCYSVSYAPSPQPALRSALTLAPVFSDALAPSTQPLALVYNPSLTRSADLPTPLPCGMCSSEVGDITSGPGPPLMMGTGLPLLFTSSLQHGPGR